MSYLNAFVVADSLRKAIRHIFEPHQFGYSFLRTRREAVGHCSYGGDEFVYRDKVTRTQTSIASGD